MPIRSVRRFVSRRPVSLRIFRRYVVRIFNELEDVFLRYLHMINKLPGSMIEVRYPFAGKFCRKIPD
jgi:hypothetical protein